MMIFKGLNKITWHDPEFDWYYYNVLKECECGCSIKLKGANDPETGGKHEGNVFWVRVDEIKKIEKK